ncbi:porin [Variovorax sp.]|uniref:porin n=1 Tax=Variovorax sp. TaxID=1871043 RepID=UPI002D5470F0|nr:porin [Variovorax sp.]HYP83092.1 porin [Variovorax sp.]
MKLQRALSAAALALMVMPLHAQSNVQVFGLLDTMVYHKELAGRPSMPSDRVDGGGLNTSFLGFRGAEELGRGLRVRFELTSFFRSDTGQMGRSDTDPFFSRSSWVGLQGGWGAASLGRQTTLSFTNMVRYSAFGGSSSFNPSFLHNYLSSITQPMLTGSGAADSAWNNAVSYETPKFAGLVGALYYAPSESTNAGRRFGASLSFTRGAFSMGLVGERIDDMSLNYAAPPTVALMRDSRLWNLGASYDLTFVKLYAQMISTSLSNAATDIDLDTVTIGGSVPIGPGKVLVSYGQTSKSQTRQADVKRETTSLAYDYSLSRRTDLYTVFMHDGMTGKSSGNGYAVGIRHRF